jgi:hypothetical protein
MKYLVKYQYFLEGAGGAIPKIEKNKDEKTIYASTRAKQEKKSLEAYLQHSPTMKDITCLIMEQARNQTIYDENTGKPLHWRKRQEQNIIYSKDPFKYNVKIDRETNNVSIHFDFSQSNRYFGQEVIITRKYDSVDYVVSIEENSKKTFTNTYDDIETALRNCWAFFVSRFKIYTISTKYVKEITREKLLEDKSLWNKQYNAKQLIDLLSINSIDQEVNGEKVIDYNTVVNLLNGTFQLLGMKFDIYEEEDDYTEEDGVDDKGNIKYKTSKKIDKNRIKLPTRFGVKENGQQNLLSMILEGLTKIESSQGATFENTKKPHYVETKRNIRSITSFTDDMPKKGIYYIQPRNTKECFIQCLQKVYRLYQKHYNSEHVSSITDDKDGNIYYGAKVFKKPVLRKLIFTYTTLIADSVLKNGLECLHEIETFYKALYGCVKISDTDTLEISSIIKNNAPKFWEEISKYDKENLEISADLGDMGFGD